MTISEEIGYEIEEYLPEDAIVKFQAYKWDPSDNDVKAIIVIVHEELGERKAMDLGLKAVETGAEIADKVAAEADKVVGKAKDKWEK